MIAVISKTISGTAYQFLAETVQQLKNMELPTGTVTVQMPDEMNNVPGRCYVPTAWGTAILDVGDFFVVYSNGMVAAFTSTQFSALFDTDTSDQLDILELEEPVAQRMMTTSDVDQQLVVEKSTAPLSAVATDEAVPVLKLSRGELNAQQLESVLSNYFNRYRLDYTMEVEENLEKRWLDVTIRVNATGREVVKFNPAADMLFGYADGRMVTQQ